MKRTGWNRMGMMLLALAALPWVAGCDDCYDGDCCGDGWHRDHRAPAPPVGVRSITGDGRVTLTWLDGGDEDVRGYRVYVSNHPDGPYDEIGDTRRLSFVDYGAVNGRTYFYAVAALDFCGNESDLSYEDVFDTPRPEGHGLELRSVTSRADRSAYDFSEFAVRPPDDPGADIVFRDDAGPSPAMFAATPGTRLQDMGYLPLVDLDWAPDGGWAPSGRVDLIRGHTYAVLTRDGFYAKFEVISLIGDRVVLDWAVQMDRGNRELSIAPPVAGAS